MKTQTTNINGYIEGYYGRVLKWPERHAILKKLKKCGFNTYFYCPKEDLQHRLKWRTPYSKRWISSFIYFCKLAEKLGINVLIGLSPGLDYDFKNNSIDFSTLVLKAKSLKFSNLTKIVLMLDDIPEMVSEAHSTSLSEGFLHAQLANLLSKEMKEIIYVVPRVYADELITDKNNYLEDFGKHIKEKIPVFYCGEKIVSNTNDIKELKTLRKSVKNEIIFWDNLYANDYCPSKIFLGPFLGRKNFDNVMVNPTGLIKTDLFLLDLISLTGTHNNMTNWKRTLKKHNIPEEFLIICEYLYPINHNLLNQNNKYSYKQKIEALDFLLWKWKTPLSKEWYQYLLILKQSLQLFLNSIDNKRIKKIFPIPLYDAIIKRK